MHCLCHGVPMMRTLPKFVGLFCRKTYKNGSVFQAKPGHLESLLMVVTPWTTRWWSRMIENLRNLRFDAKTPSDGIAFCHPNLNQWGVEARNKYWHAVHSQHKTFTSPQIHRRSRKHSVQQILSAQEMLRPTSRTGNTSTQDWYPGSFAPLRARQTWVRAHKFVSIQSLYHFP